MPNFFEDSLEINFDRLKQDLGKRGLSRLLWQFRKSPVINQVVQKLCEEFQDTYDAEIGVLEGRTLAKGEGLNLDMIGSLVGQSRNVKNIDPTDDNYRRLIFAKILKNHTHAGSLTEVRYIASKISGMDFSEFSYLKTGIQCYRMIVRYGFNPDSIKLLRELWKNMQVDNFYLLPVPATVYIDTNVIIVTPEGENWFGPDLQESRPDYAKLAVGAHIGEN